MPTGDPNCNPEVKAAKRAKQAIRDIGEGTSDIDLLLSDDNDDDYEDGEFMVPPDAPAGAGNGNVVAGSGNVAARVEQAPHREDARTAHCDINLVNDDMGHPLAAATECHHSFAAAPLLPQGILPQPYPVRFSRKNKNCSMLDMNTILQLCQMQMMQSIAQSAVDQRSTEEDKKECKEEHHKQHKSDDRMMKMMMIMMLGNALCNDKHDGKSDGKKKRKHDDSDDDEDFDNHLEALDFD